MSIAILGHLGEFLAGSQVQFLYWSLAIFGTVFFLVMIVMTFVGIGTLHDSDVSPDGTIADHADSGYGDFKLISVRSVLAFITFFGWGGVIWGRLGVLGFLIALFCGSVMMSASAAIIFFILRLQHSGNVASEDFIGKTGSVYLGIPGGRAQPGKATITVAGYTHEIPVVADEPIPTGTPVSVVEKLDDRKFLVKKS